MTNIYDFPSRDAETGEEGFLQQGSDTLAFDESGKNVDFSRNVYQSIERSRAYEAMDWSNQELASIYRVKCLLDAAEVPCTVERGQSDEGDPWCVYCTPGGDVFIHLCRIAGTYILDSPNLSAPISGQSFSQLIDRFSNGALNKKARGGNRKYRVVKLSGGDNVFLHPATLLAALIWSIHQNSEDLILLSGTDAGHQSQDDAIRLVNDLAEDPPVDLLLNESDFIGGHSSDTSLAPARLPAHLDPEEPSVALGADHGLHRDLGGKQGMFLHQTTIATGLTAIAVAVGLLSDTLMEQHPDAQFADLIAALTDEHDDDFMANATGPDKLKGIEIAAVLTSFFDHLVPDVENSALSKDIAAEISPDTQGPAVSDDAIQLLTMVAKDIGTDGVAKTAGDTIHDAVIAYLLKDSPARIADIAKAPPSLMSDVPALSDFVENALRITGLHDMFDNMLRQYAVGNTIVEASFDIAAIDTGQADALARILPQADDTFTEARPLRQDEAETSPALQQTGDGISDHFTDSADFLTFDLFDSNARDFVNHLLKKSDTVEMIATEHELIFIDFAAFDEITDTSHSMSWSLNGGGTISIVGLASEFQDFELIA